MTCMKIDGCLARNIEFEVAARFWGSVGQLVGTFEDVLRDMLTLRLLQVSSRFSGFLVASLCLWEKPRNLSFLRVSTEVVLSFCVARLS